MRASLGLIDEAQNIDINRHQTMVQVIIGPSCFEKSKEGPIF